MTETVGARRLAITTATVATRRLTVAAETVGARRLTVAAETVGARGLAAVERVCTRRFAVAPRTRPWGNRDRARGLAVQRAELLRRISVARWILGRADLDLKGRTRSSDDNPIALARQLHDAGLARRLAARGQGIEHGGALKKTTELRHRQRRDRQRVPSRAAEHLRGGTRAKDQLRNARASEVRQQLAELRHAK